jgi:hypothetical protein
MAGETSTALNVGKEDLMRLDTSAADSGGFSNKFNHVGASFDKLGFVTDVRHSAMLLATVDGFSLKDPDFGIKEQFTKCVTSPDTRALGLDTFVPAKDPIVVQQPTQHFDMIQLG